MNRENFCLRIADEMTTQIGTKSDFARAVQLHRPQIFRLLFASLRDPDLAETLTQDCFLKALRSWPGFRGDSSVKTWLTRIAMNVRNDYWRNRRAQFWQEANRNSLDIDIACEWLPSGETSPEALLVAREQMQQVWVLVKSLTDKQRTVFLLRYVEELNLKDIVRTTGMREGTVKAHLWRAVRRIRRGLRGGDALICARRSKHRRKEEGC